MSSDLQAFAFTPVLISIVIISFLPTLWSETGQVQSITGLTYRENDHSPPQTSLSLQFNLTCMSLDCWRKLEHSEKTHGDTGWTCKLPKGPGQLTRFCSVFTINNQSTDVSPIQHVQQTCFFLIHTCLSIICRPRRMHSVTNFNGISPSCAIF